MKAEKATKGRLMREILAPGSRAPDFRLPREDGTQVSLRSLRGRKVVLYFYPRADTPGCTREAIAFNARRRQFETAGTVILGVSADPLKAQQNFRDKHALAFPLLSDETHKMLEAYGAWGEKSLYGKKYTGVHRITYLIDEQGVIARVWPKVQVDGHADEVLAAATSLPAGR
jgi:peroxiredoxin Q/BCP